MKRPRYWFWILVMIASMFIASIIDNFVPLVPYRIVLAVLAIFSVYMIFQSILWEMKGK